MTLSLCLAMCSLGFLFLWWEVVPVPPLLQYLSTFILSHCHDTHSGKCSSITLRLKDNGKEAITQTHALSPLKPRLIHPSFPSEIWLVNISFYEDTLCCILVPRQVRLRIPSRDLWHHGDTTTQLNGTWNDGTYCACAGTYCAHGGTNCVRFFTQPLQKENGVRLLKIYL